MSGSGGGGGGGDYPAVERCEDLVIDTQLSSPKPAVVNGLKKGDVLQVAVQTVGSTAVVVVTHQGQLAGGLASPEIQRLRECINKGVRYIATVVAKNAGQVTVRVTAAK